MATKIPLNFFRRVSKAVTNTDQPIYTCPDERAGIIISAYATNTTNTTQTVNVKLSTDGVTSSMYTIVSALPILPNDAVNVTINKIVLGEQDVFIVSAENNNAVNITLSILESINTP
jgi:hypothetical protein